MEQEESLLSIVSELARHVADLSKRISTIEYSIKTVDRLSVRVDKVSEKLLDIESDKNIDNKKYIRYKNKDIDFIDVNDPVTKYILVTSGLCPCCKRRKADSEHHIIPRSVGGEDTSRNRIKLCRRCHDYIELKTDACMKGGLSYGIDLLKMMIINDAFNVEYGE